jgi:uncharacterized protein (TIGR02118 family)
MSFSTTILYPKLEEGQFFNLDYYLSEHMNKVKAAWESHGLKSWKVLKFSPEQDGTPAPYHVGALLIWESAEAAKAAFGAPGTKGVVEDVANFTNTKSIRLNGSVEASSA